MLEKPVALTNFVGANWPPLTELSAVVKIFMINTIEPGRSGHGVQLFAGYLLYYNYSQFIFLISLSHIIAYKNCISKTYSIF